MLKLKQKDKSPDKKPKPSNPHAKKNAQAVVLAALVAFAANFFIWNQLVKPHNQQVFDIAVAKAVNEHQQVIAHFIETTQARLLEAGNQLAAIKIERGEPDWDFFKAEGFELEKVLQNSDGNITALDVYSVDSLTPDRIQEHGLSFIDIDMLNKAVRGLPVFPEAVRQADGEQWLIHWAAPIADSGSTINIPTNTPANTPAAVLLVKTTTASLEKALAQADNALLKIDLIQNIGHSGQRVFLSKGNGSRQDSQSGQVGESFWEVRVLPSEAFESDIFELPIWMMALLAIVTALCIAPAVWLLLKPVPEKTVDEDTRLLREKYQKKPTHAQQESQGDGDIDETEVVLDESPLDVAPPTPEPIVDEVGPMLNESYVVPDSVFRAYDIRGVVGEELSFELAQLIGQSIASEVLAAGDKAIIVGHDTRTHSPELAHHLQQGIISTGCDVIDAGLVPTPLLNFATIFSNETHSGVVVTASHNPKDYNGFKVIINEKSLQAKEMQALKQRIVNNNFTKARSQGEIRQTDFKEDYIDTVLADIAVGPEIKVVVDAANGAASELAPALYRDLGCEVVPLYCEFNGEFPNHDPDPCNESNLQALIQKVVEENATVGIALDGDGDRLVVVTPKGRVIWPDQLLMIFVKDVVGRNPGCDVVFDIKSTRHLSQLIASYGGRPVMWKTGHSHIKNKMIETNALLAGEFSGHIFFKERWFGFDDGMYAAARLLEILSLSDDSLDDLLADMPKSVSTPEIKIAVGDSEKMAFMTRFIEQSHFESGEKTLIDGLRVDFAKGWGLVRASNTSPALTLRFEGDNMETIEKLKTIFKRELIKIDSQLQLDF